MTVQLDESIKHINPGDVFVADENNILRYCGQYSERRNRLLDMMHRNIGELSRGQQHPTLILMNQARWAELYGYIPCHLKRCRAELAEPNFVFCDATVLPSAECGPDEVRFVNERAPNDPILNKTANIY